VSRLGDAWLLEDAASTNGTFRDGVRVQQIEIDDTVTVRLGHPVEGVAVQLEPEFAPATAVTAPAVAASSHRSIQRSEAVPHGAPDPFALQRQLIWAIWALAASILLLAAVVAVVTLS
jgi:phytoene dehydrogenase-like protein